MSFGSYSGVVLLTAIFTTLVPKLLNPAVPAHVTVDVAPGWERLADIFRNIIEENPTRGYAFAVYHKGELVADLFGGYADYQAWVPWKADTLGYIFSATKGWAGICVALLADRGLIDYKKPVSDYWPEFDDVGHGRENITVEMLLSQQSGLTSLGEDWSVFDLGDDPDKISRLLLKNIPQWEPGTAHGYHPTTHGLYINELIVRVDPQHRTIDQFFLDEVAEPLEMDAMIGLPLEEYHRSVRIMPATTGVEDIQSILFDNGWRFLVALSDYMYNNPLRRACYKELGQDGIYNHPEVRRVPFASANGFGTARDVAKLYGVLSAGGTYNSKMFMSEDMVKHLSEAVVSGTDFVMGIPTSFGRGTSVKHTPANSIKYGFPGAGGNAAFGDLEHQLGFSFMTTKMYTGMGASPQFLALEKAMYESVQKITLVQGQS